MKRVAILIILLSPLFLNAQSSNFEPGRSIKTIKSSNGGKLTFGSSSTKGKGPLSYLLISRGKTKAERWKKTYGGTSYDRAADIVATADGDYLLSGSTSSYGAGNYDVLIIKIDARGKKQWQKTYGEFYNEYTESLTAEEDGTYIIKVRKQFCDVKNDSSTCADGDQFIKIDALGNKIWEKSAMEYSSK